MKFFQNHLLIEDFFGNFVLSLEVLWLIHAYYVS